MIDTVEDRWRALLARGEPELREVDAESPLRMLIGVSPVGRPYFAVIVAQKPGLPDLTSAIEVTRRQRAADGRWTLTLELQVRALTDAFISLVSDLAAKSALAASEQEALNIFLETLAEWQELLDRPRRPSLRERASRLDRGALVRLRVGSARASSARSRASVGWPIGRRPRLPVPRSRPLLRGQVIAAESYSS